MKIKKFSQFITESIKGFNSIGEYIESLSKDNEYALNIISQYTSEIDPSIRLANAINLLEKDKQETILDLITKDKKGDDEEEDPTVITNTDLDILESNTLLGGKNLFKCFLKSITALGQKNIKQSDENPESYITFYKTDIVDSNVLTSVLSRFRYFELFLNDLTLPERSGLYYGMKTDLTFEYGLNINDKNVVIGQFKITKSTINFITSISSPSVVSLKLFLSNLDISSIKLVSKIVKEVSNFNPGYFEKKSNPVIKDNIITFGYYGIGKWDNGKMDIGEIENAKQNFKSFLIKFKWVDLIQVSINTNQFWLYLNIKLK